jgi:peptidoglycan/xylan/chitin deacetylase (PgdA/CDA1 family)
MRGAEGWPLASGGRDATGSGSGSQPTVRLRPGARPRAAPTDGPEPPRLTVALSFDHDGISSAVARELGPHDRSRGEFGVRVGVPRVLDVLASHGVPATFFVSGHTAVTFPKSVAAIVGAGHELGCHGWAHEDAAVLAEPAEREILARSRAAITEAAGGVAPAGFRAPHRSLAERTLALVEEAGFAYDSSLAWDDYRLGRVRHDDVHAVERSVLGRPGRLVEVPISDQLDDRQHFEPSRGRGAAAIPSAVEEIWLAELRYAHAPGGVVTYTMHPECIGRGSRIAVLERLILAARELPGVAFARLDATVARWVAVHGG